MKIISYIFICLLHCLPFTNITSGKELDNSIAEKADLYLGRMVPFGFSGAVLISNRESILLNKGYGYADPQSKILNTSATIYSLGSIVKPFTATLTMRLVQEGKLSLENTLSDFFTNVPNDKLTISIHQLLSHTSGLPGAIGLDTEYISKQDYRDKAMETELNFIPGENYAYSNVGFTLLAMIIEKVTVMSYEQYLKKTILDPAGMSNTGYSLQWDKSKLAHNISNGTDHGTFLDRQHFPTWHLIGNGGILSTTEDMYKFYLFMKNGNLLSEESQKLMWTPVFMEDAYGWVSIDGGEILEHNGGSSDGNGAVMKWYPNDDIFMMIFTNSTMDGRSGFEVVQRPLEHLLYSDEIAIPPAIKPIKFNDFLDISGTYSSDDNAKFVIERDSNNFSFLLNNQQSLNLFFDSGQESENISDNWNDKIHNIMKLAISDQKYDRLSEISSKPEKLKKTIINELAMEGYENPESKVLYSSRIDDKTTKTIVAISDNNFEGPAMLFHMVFKNGIYAGIGVDFGMASTPKLTAIPISSEQLTAYDFNKNVSVAIQIDKIKNGKLEKITINNKSVNISYQD